MRWEKRDIDTLAFMWKSGWKTKDIANAMGVSKNAVIGKAHRLNLPKRPNPVNRPANDTGRAIEIKKPQGGYYGDDVKKHAKDKSALNIDKTAYGKIKTLEELKAKDCRWPIGDPKHDDFGYCGAEVVKGRVYCLEHAKIAYRGTPRENSNHEYVKTERI